MSADGDVRCRWFVIGGGSLHSAAGTDLQAFATVERSHSVSSVGGRADRRDRELDRVVEDPSGRDAVQDAAAADLVALLAGISGHMRGHCSLRSTVDCPDEPGRDLLDIHHCIVTVARSFPDHIRSRSSLHSAGNSPGCILDHNTHTVHFRSLHSRCCSLDTGSRSCRDWAVALFRSSVVAGAHRPRSDRKPLCSRGCERALCGPVGGAWLICR